MFTHNSQYSSQLGDRGIKKVEQREVVPSDTPSEPLQYDCRVPMGCHARLGPKKILQACHSYMPIK